jgi:hypothetical protein
VTTFDIGDVRRYRSEYPVLAQVLGVPGARPAPGEVEFLCELIETRRPSFGMLLAPDILFAAALASILSPQVAIEIGTASGFSAVVLAKMMALRGQQVDAMPNGTLVHTIDSKAQYCEDPTKAVGFCIELLAPELRDQIAVHPSQDSSYCRQLLRSGELMLAFVDGNHRHPWPLLDVLQIQRLMRSGWILMHDIDLPAHAERARAAGQPVDYVPSSGAKYVFDSWPGDKISGGNIGAIKTPEDQRSLRDFVAKLRQLPPEVSAGSWKKRWRDIDELAKEF